MSDRIKKANYKLGAVKRKLSISTQDKVETGDLISKANANKKLTERELAIRGLI